MTLEKRLQHYRLSSDEYQKMKEVLGREPQGVEWALFSALWSEHCSYKSSRVHLKKFYNHNERVVESFGENAGVIDLGEGERVAFKMESHNHPSYIEPYQGAATGVGGILRDIFTMGARPIALADYLCFGRPQADRMETLVDGVVRGIGGYGNCVGVPTVTGQTEFHSSYDGNILVNAMAVGLFRPGENIFISKASGPGNAVVYVGAKTGKDGVHGASMASESFDDDSEAKKPTVQIGDPFFEKLLIESCLEVMAENLVVAIQDMGAAGLTSSSFEMASKGGVGLRLDLDKVPIRDSSITPEEILLSESQERMLLICEPKNIERLKAVFTKWDLDAEVIGEVIEEKQIKLNWHNEEICAIDPDVLVENAPQYQRPYEDWQPKNKVDAIVDSTSGAANNNGSGSQTSSESSEGNFKQNFAALLKDHRACDRHWIYDQYDQRVGAMTSRGCDHSVAIQRLPDSGRALGITLGCRPHVMRMDAREGGKDAVLFTALQLAAKGFKALAVTDCLNFGNPEKPEVMGEFVAAVEAISSACEAVDTPVISGNVSFYNETRGMNITSTPSIGMVGLRDSIEKIPESRFVSEEDQIFLLRLPQLQSTGYISEIYDDKQTAKFSGGIETKEVAKFVDLVRQMANSEAVKATRVVGKFGLAYNLARMCTDKLGCELEEDGHYLENSSWTQENFYEVLFVVDQDRSAQFAKSWSQLRNDNGEDQMWRIGEVTAGKFILGQDLEMDLKELNENYKGGWKQIFSGLA